MKFDFDKEVDSLLRWSARQFAASAADSSEAISQNSEPQAVPAQMSAHLETDELSAYAENALPVPTRMRYAAHLADCEKCRKIAIDIALAANIAGELEERAKSSAEIERLPSWRARLTALLAPNFLRYAVPAFALLLIGIIAFVVTRTRPTETFVAQREEPAQVRTAVTQGREPSEQTEQTAPRPVPAEVGEVKSSRPAPPEGKVAATEATAPSQPQASLPARESASPTPLSTATSPAPASAPAPEPPPPAKPTENKQITTLPELPSQSSSDTETAKIQSERKDEDRNAGANQEDSSSAGRRARSSQEKREVENERLAARDTMNDSAGGGVAGTSQPMKAKKAPAQSSAPVARRRAIVSAEEKSDAPATSSETRNISGHRFRRQGSAWVDTSYNSSQSAINVARGSEQYRALIADEPELRHIAEQLSGEVIVVWKGRAYRIY